MRYYKWLAYLALGVASSLTNISTVFSESPNSENKQLDNASEIEKIRVEIDRRIRYGSQVSGLGESKSSSTQETSEYSKMTIVELNRKAMELGGAKTIYGIDDRRDWWEFKDDLKIKSLAEASVALFDSKNIEKNSDGKWYVKKSLSLKERKNLCPGQKFQSQVTGAFCSGTLVGEDKVLTAGHCTYDLTEDPSIPWIEDIKFIFGFRVLSEGGTGLTKFEDKQVYSGKYFDGQKDSHGYMDWVLIELDRKVTVAKPVMKRMNEKIKNTAKVFVIGHPSELPVKYAPGAEISDNRNQNYFRAKLDVFGGNSGSGVYEEGTNKLAGILVYGGADYEPENETDCNEAYVCPDSGCGGEYVASVSIVNFP